jgi:hypothetical protein
MGSLTFASGAVEAADDVASGSPDIATSVIDAGTTVKLSGPTDNQVNFAAVTGTLTLQNSSSFDGQISGFGGEDRIDLADVFFGTSTTLAYSNQGNDSGTTLTVSDGVNLVNINLIGNYTIGNFILGEDGGGGTLVYDRPIVANGGALASTPADANVLGGNNSDTFAAPANGLDDDNVQSQVGVMTNAGGTSFNSGDTDSPAGFPSGGGNMLQPAEPYRGPVAANGENLTSFGTDANALGGDNNNLVNTGSDDVGNGASLYPQNNGMLAYDPPLVADSNTSSLPTTVNAFDQNNDIAAAGATDVTAGASTGGEMNQFNQALFANFAAALAPDPESSSGDSFAGVSTTPGSGSPNGGDGLAGVATMPDPAAPSGGNAFMGAVADGGSSTSNPAPGVIANDQGPASGIAGVTSGLSDSSLAPAGVTGGALDMTPSIGGAAFAGTAAYSEPSSNNPAAGGATFAPAVAPPITWQQSLALMGNYMASSFAAPALIDSGIADPSVSPVPLAQSSLAPQPLMNH